MGGICSRNRGQVVDEAPRKEIVRRYIKSGSSKWLGSSYARQVECANATDTDDCTSLLEFCVYQICQVCALHMFCQYIITTLLSKVG